MITCKTCKKLKTCTRLCPRVESLLPKEDTGKDHHREISMDMDDFLAAAEIYSYTAWHHEELVSTNPALDLSDLSGKEKKALLLMAKGASQREASALMRISRASFRTLINRAFKRHTHVLLQKMRLLRRATTFIRTARRALQRT